MNVEQLSPLTKEVVVTGKRMRGFLVESDELHNPVRTQEEVDQTLEDVKNLVDAAITYWNSPEEEYEYARNYLQTRVDERRHISATNCCI